MMSTRQSMSKKRQFPSKWFFRSGVVLSLICMFLLVSVPSAFAKSDSDGKVKVASVKNDKKKPSNRFLGEFVKGGEEIVSSPQGLKCKDGNCSGQFSKGTKNVQKTVRDVFSEARLVRLIVKIKGDGKVQSNPPELSCQKGYCAGRFQAGTVVTVLPQSGIGQSLSGWRGACNGSGPCRLTLNRPRVVGAIFEPQGPQEMIPLEARIIGEGSIESQPAGLSCMPGLCTGKFPVGTQVTLTAVPKPGNEFSGWGGACSEKLGCQVTMDAPKAMTATFTLISPPPTVKLSVTVEGNGVVTSTPGNLSCESGTCEENFDEGIKVVLSAQPKPDFKFDGWSLPCSGIGPCEVTMSEGQSVTATFTPLVLPPVAFSVIVEGEGRVTSDPAGIDCPAVACTHDFENGKQVTLLPEPKTGHMFDGWSEGCMGKEACTVTLKSPIRVKAVFTLIPLPPVALSVTVEGNGNVTSTPAGIDCPTGNCAHDFTNGEMLVLTARANTGQVFSEWKGDCTGMGTSCQLKMTSGMTVMAIFVPGNPGMTDQEAKRFLEQATWGPTPELIAHVKSIGKEAFLDEQLALNTSTYPDPSATPDSSSLTPTRNQFFFNAFHADDQLRQRVAFALGQIFVVSANTVGADFQMVPYLRLLHNGAFGNYEDLLLAVTLSPTMGRFLDMVNNDKTEPGSGLNPNENYPREFLQLLTVGTTLLNSDGTDQPGSNAPYDQEVILNLSRVMTGWTYPTKPGATARWRNPSFYDGPMISFDDHHDMEAKVLMNGFLLPAGQTAVEDLNQAIHHVFEHPNVGPFVATRLIRHLVTSNPSPQYIARVTQVFNANGNGMRGDLSAVIKAILLDSEAASVLPNGGHLREPVLFEIALLRALGATVDPANPLYNQARSMGQSLFSPPSVFNYFSPLYRIPGTQLYGPEFQIHSFSNAMARANFVDRAVRSSLGTGATVDLSTLEAIADDAGQLVDRVVEMLLHETLSAAEHQSIVAAISATTTPSTRVRNAVYLVATSSRYQVQH